MAAHTACLTPGDTATDSSPLCPHPRFEAGLMDGGTYLRWFRRKECGLKPAVSPSAFLSWLDGWRRIPTMVPVEGVRTRARCVPIRVSTRGDGRRPSPSG